LISVTLSRRTQVNQGMNFFREEGIASWYGREFDGRPTASGETFDSSELTAAHPNLPFGTMLIVTNKHNNRSVTVRVNDRGPFVAARIIDVSRAAAEQLDMIVSGTAPVIVESFERTFPNTARITYIEEYPRENATIYGINPSDIIIPPEGTIYGIDPSGIIPY